MTEQQVVDLVSQAAWLSVKIAAPGLAITLIIGLLVSIFQAATQVNEQTLSFIPKILGFVAVMIFFGPWALQSLIDFTHSLLMSLPQGAMS